MFPRWGRFSFGCLILDLSKCLCFSCWRSCDGSVFVLNCFWGEDLLRAERIKMGGRNKFFIYRSLRRICTSCGLDVELDLCAAKCEERMAKLLSWMSRCFWKSHPKIDSVWCLESLVSRDSLVMLRLTRLYRVKERMRVRIKKSNTVPCVIWFFRLNAMLSYLVDEFFINW